MKMPIRHLLLVVFFLIPFALFAQEMQSYETLEMNFEQDTARVEQQMRDMLDNDYSTLGMIDAALVYEKSYDTLLNIYYSQLLNSLNVEEQEVLKTSQRNWIKLQDSEKALIQTLKNKAYTESEGGSVWSVVSVDATARITRQRVFELYGYLMFGDLGGR